MQGTGNSATTGRLTEAQFWYNADILCDRGYGMGVPCQARSEAIWSLMLRRFQQMEPIFLAASAALLGAVTALGSYLFHLGIENGLVGEGFRAVFRLASGHKWVLFAHSQADTKWGYFVALVLPILGLVAAAYLARLLCPGEAGHGVAGIMEAVALRGGRLRVRPAVARVMAAVITIVTGGSVGPEDPNVQIGATVGSWFAQQLRLPSERVRTLAACGAASGIASAFNAPIAGVFFAQEIILGEFTTGGFGMVVLAAVTASVITRVLRGDSPAFRIPEYTLRSPWELFLYLGLGLAAALLSTLYVRGLVGIEERFHAWRAPFWLRAAVGGALVGVAGIAFPQLFGVGYDTMDGLLHGEPVAVWVLAALMVLKPLLTATTLAAGGSGGVFAPSLFIGGMLGGAFGQMVGKVLPNVVGPPGAYALVGMGGVLAGAVHCPITAILLLFEMTRDYRIILPIMLCAAVSTLLSRRLSPGSVYTARLAKRGIYLEQGRDRGVLERVSVEEAMAKSFASVPPDMPLEELGRFFWENREHGAAVVDAGGHLVGVVTLSDYASALEEGRGEQVGDICVRNPVTLFPDQSLHEAMLLMAANGIGRVPVVSRQDPRRVVGLVGRSDVIRAYRVGLSRQLEAERRLQQMRLASHRGGELLTVPLTNGAPAVGRPVRALNLPFGTIIVTIQRGERAIIPRGDTTLREGDTLVLMVDSPENGALVRALLLEGKGLPEKDSLCQAEYVLSPGSAGVGKRIADLGLPRGSLVVRIVRQSNELVPHGDTVLEVGDRVVVELRPEDQQAVENCLQGANPEKA